MFIDFLINSSDISDAELKTLIKDVMQTKLVKSVTVPYYLLKVVKPFISTNTSLACLIDYPCGNADLYSRQILMAQAVKAGANILDISVPQVLAAARKYDKIREDVKNCSDFAKLNNVTVRYILDYRVFDHHVLKKICEILDDFGIEFCFPSSGYFIDDINDHLIASIFLYKNSKNLKIVCAGNAWTEAHFDKIQKSGLYGFRTSSLFALQNYQKIDSKQEKENNGV